MAIVRDIGNLKTTKVTKDTVFALDTNVLLWTFYSRTTVLSNQKKVEYSNFIAKLISNGNKIYILGHNLNEMMHVIERNEYEIYIQRISSKIGLKQFRKNSKYRAFIQNEITLIINQLKSIPNIDLVDSKFLTTDIDRFTTDYLLHQCDFFDFLLIDFCNQHNCAVITDDKDFDTNYLKTELYTYK